MRVGQPGPVSQSGAAAALNLSVMTGPAPLAQRPDLNNNNNSVGGLVRRPGSRDGLGSAHDSIGLR